MRKLNQELPGSDLNNSGAQVTETRVFINDQDIIILGGRCASGVDKVSNTAEKFNIAEGKSTELPAMNTPRAESAACVHRGDVMVTGGSDGQGGTDTIEILKMTDHPLRWTMFGGKLSVKTAGHAAIIYQNKLYVIGGHNWNEQKTSDMIYELDLARSSSASPLARMRQARQNHRAEIVNEKVFIVGGTTTGRSKDAIDSVTVYDFITKQFRGCKPLPIAVCDMSTVSMGNTIIVVGGVDKNGQVLNDVIMYDTETGGSKRLPSMKHKRHGSSAVIIDDIIVVFGGRNEEQKHLKSVECFKMRWNVWKELPDMNQKRAFPSAAVISRIVPSRRTFNSHENRNTGKVPTSTHLPI